VAATNNPKQPGFPDRYFYDRKFLLAFQQAPDCAKKPACLPNLDIVLDTAHQPTQPVVPGKTYVSALISKTLDISSCLAVI